MIGMGNRFKSMTSYKTLIKGHAILACIVFLAIIPAAIMIKRFHTEKPLRAIKIHISLQILTVFLMTAVFVLGNIAVGSTRALTNPHHGIGLAIYVLVLGQFIGGWFVHSREKHAREKGKIWKRAPVKVLVSLPGSSVRANPLIS